jgi:hypothetical protein
LTQLSTIRGCLFGTATLFATPLLAAGQFDGRWSVSLQCPASSDGALPFAWRFEGTVRDGDMRAVHGQPGQPGYLLLSGRIDPDGNAAISAQGITGTKGYNVRSANSGVPYTYPVSARFSGRSGRGYWTTVRRCDFSFERH